jgi:putative endonuclease
MYYVYVIVEKYTNRRYIGLTSDLKSRMAAHNKSQGARYTKKGKWKLVYYEAFACESDAYVREKKLKHDGRSRYQLYRRIGKSLFDHK